MPSRWDLFLRLGISISRGLCGGLRVQDLGLGVYGFRIWGLGVGT